MIKYFLYTLLIITSSTIICSDDSFLNLILSGPLRLALGVRLDEEYFVRLSARLTDQQRAAYQSKINTRIAYLSNVGDFTSMGMLPIEYASKEGDVELTRWLLSNGARVKGSDALKLILVNGGPNKAEVVTILLAHGATTDFLIRDEAPLACMKSRLHYWIQFKKDHPAAAFVTDRIASIASTITVLEEHESDKRWSPARAAWCGAAWRGCEARTKKGLKL